MVESSPRRMESVHRQPFGLGGRRHGWEQRRRVAEPLREADQPWGQIRGSLPLCGWRLKSTSGKREGRRQERKGVLRGEQEGSW